jgi:hypothetical protein
MGLSSGVDLHVAPHYLYSVGWFDDRLWRSRSRLLCYGLEVLSPRGAVMTMTLVCCLDETLFVEVCVGYSLCAAQRFVMVFTWFSIN